MQQLGMPVVAMPTPGSVGGRPRKEPIYDTELLKGGATTPTQITLFRDYTQFRLAPTNTTFGQNKQFGRDSNLTGRGQLPNAHLFFWYGWQGSVWTYGADLADADNVGVFEQIQRWAAITGVSVKFTQTTLITVPLTDIPAGAGAGPVFTTHPGATVFSQHNGVADRGNMKDMRVNGQPTVINALQDFSLVFETPEGSISPVVDLYVKHKFEGILVRGIT